MLLPTYLASSSTSNWKACVVQGKRLQYRLEKSMECTTPQFSIWYISILICIILRIKLNNLLCCHEYFQSVWLTVL